MIYTRVHAHEAGHCLAAHHYGHRVLRVRCGPRDGLVTYEERLPTVYDPSPYRLPEQHAVLRRHHDDHEQTRLALEDAVVTLAGREGEQLLFGFVPADGRDDSDRQVYQQLLAETFGDGMTTWPRAERLAREIVATHRAEVKQLARLLAAGKVTPGREVRRLLNQLGIGPTANRSTRSTS